MEEIVNELIKLNKTVSTMESCTGGALSNAITNVPNASNIFSFGAVTYSNEYKIKIGVNKDTIDKYSVYSIEVAKEMSNVISNYTNSNYGVGITGKLNKTDLNNMYGDDNKVYVSLYDRDNNKYYTDIVVVKYSERCRNKELVLECVIKLFKEVL